MIITVPGMDKHRRPGPCTSGTGNLAIIIMDVAICSTTT